MAYNADVETILTRAMDELEGDATFDRGVLDGLRALATQERIGDSEEVRKLLAALEEKTA